MQCSQRRALILILWLESQGPRPVYISDQSASCWEGLERLRSTVLRQTQNSFSNVAAVLTSLAVGHRPPGEARAEQTGSFFPLSVFKRQYVRRGEYLGLFVRPFFPSSPHLNNLTGAPTYQREEAEHRSWPKALCKPVCQLFWLSGAELSHLLLDSFLPRWAHSAWSLKRSRSSEHSWSSSQPRIMVLSLAHAASCPDTLCRR